MASGLRNKRKLENEEQSEREKEGNLEEEESEHEKETKPEYEEQSKSSSAAECSFKVQESWTTSSSGEDDDETDRSYTDRRLTDGEEGNFPASKWKYVDLKNMNVHYNKKPDPIEEFTQNVKADVLENYPNIPDFEKNVKRLSSLTKENVLISCEKLFTSYDLNTAGDEHKNYLEIELMKKIQNDLGRMNKVDKDLDYRDLLKVWYVAARRFLYSTVSLIGRVIHPPKETVAVLKQKELMKSKKKRSKGKRHAGGSAERERPSESVYLHYFIKFAELFLLENTLAQACSHIGGLLFSISNVQSSAKALVQTDQSCTSSLCQWNVSRTMNQKPMPISTLNLSRPKVVASSETDVNVAMLSSPSHGSAMARFDPRHSEDRHHSLTWSLDQLRKLKASFPLTGMAHLWNIPDTGVPSVVENEVEVTTAVHPLHLKMEMMVFSDGNLPPPMIDQELVSYIEKHTRAQRLSDLWKKLHLGRITSSIFGDVLQSGDKPTSLIQQILYGSNLDKAVVKRSFVFGEKIVSSTPDLEYGFAPTPSTMPTKKENTLLFVVEAKGKPINNVSSECLEDQLDDDVLRRVGYELIAKIPFSVTFPNTLGIICMETKIIFVYLKVTKEDFELLTLPLKSQGIIHYTRSFDMLKAEDRGEICEFLYWLGCIQNRDLM